MVKEKLMERYDWQQRTALLLGEEKMERIRNAHVLVVGLGGVGAYAAEMICRAGVGRMTMVDADTVQPTNMNRQLPILPCFSYLLDSFLIVSFLPTYNKNKETTSQLLSEKYIFSLSHILWESIL